MGASVSTGDLHRGQQNRELRSAPADPVFAEQDLVLGTLVLVATIAAAGAVAFIGFVLFGPVPVNRKVTIVSRIDAPMPRPAMPIALEIPIEVPAAPPPRASRLQADGPIIQPMLRRRGNNTPPPRPRQRLARGTEERRRETFDSVEVTAPHSHSFETEERTIVVS